MTVRDGFVVCGWFTPDYAHWVCPLRQHLDMLGVPYDFVEVPKRPGGWEINTLNKPLQILAAMERYPTQTILFLDVDCQILGTSDDLKRLIDIPGDVGLYVRTRIRRRGQPLFAPRSGTLVLKPTVNARALVDTWIEISFKAPRYTVDQTSLVVALGQVPNITITTLGVEACSVPADRTPAPIILHDRAGADMKKAGSLTKLASRVWG